MYAFALLAFNVLIIDIGLKLEVIIVTHFHISVLCYLSLREFNYECLFMHAKIIFRSVSLQNYLAPSLSKGLVL